MKYKKVIMTIVRIIMLRKVNPCMASAHTPWNGIIQYKSGHFRAEYCIASRYTIKSGEHWDSMSVEEYGTDVLRMNRSTG